jgi:hypothetical protein
MALTPRDIARYDQDMTRLDELLDNLLRGIREQVAEYGEPQATANIALLLAAHTTPDQNAELLLAALRRLARQPA